jgi:hypothetical protein
MKSKPGRAALFASVLLCFLSVLGASVQSASAPATSAGAVITFRKVFKTSYPEFVEIKLSGDGTGTYDIRDLDEEASPQPLEVGPALAQRVFTLAAKLHNFQGIDLDVIAASPISAKRPSATKSKTNLTRSRSTTRSTTPPPSSSTSSKASLASNWISRILCA